MKRIFGSTSATPGSANAARPGWAKLGYPRSVFWLLMVLHLVLGISYSVAVPPWEAHDEWAHYKYAEYIARNRALPPPDQPLTTEYRYDEAGQPPLYYILASLPVMLALPDDGLKPDVNPHFGKDPVTGGINAAVHHPEQEAFPWRGTLLALHLVRFVSVLISLVGLVGVYRLGRVLAPGRPAVALWALAIAGLFPQYLFLSGVASNDVLITALGCLIAWLGVLVAAQGLRLAPMVGLSVVTGLAFLTKLSAAAALPFVLAALLIGLIRARRRGLSRRRVAALLAVPVGFALVPALLWFWRNWRLTGTVVPRDRWFWYRFVERWFDQSASGLPSLRPEEPLTVLGYGFRTFWASFGWGSLEAYPWVYWFFAGLCLAGLVGLLVWLLARQFECCQRTAAGLLLLFAASFIALAAYRDFAYGSYLLRGRYFMPVLGALSALIALGLGSLGQLLTRRWRVLPAALVGGALVVVNVMLPWQVIAAAYQPPPLAASGVPPGEPVAALPGEQPVAARFGDVAELVLYELWPETIHAGEALGVTLVWRGLSAPDRNYTLAVHLLDATQKQVGGINVYPGRGHFATTLWQPGDVFRETYWVKVSKAIREPIAGRVKVALYVNGDGQDHLPVFDPQGNSLGDALFLGRYKLASNRAPAEPLALTARATFGDVVRLSAAQWTAAAAPLVAGDVLTVTLTLDALARPAADYQVFVHLEAADRAVAYGDGPPDRGLYPTSMWERGDRVRSEHVVSLPADLAAGRYRLVMGLYDAAGVRLAAYDRDGNRWAADAVLLTTLPVARRDHHSYLPLVGRRAAAP